jgi:prepilin-type processing-associated H-X9-DG protein
MIVEAANPNWYDQTVSTQKDGEIVWLRRLGARHGKKSRAGLNAETNIAFFDGHVAKFRTEPLVVRKDGTGDQLDLLTQETIFFLNKQGSR